MRTPAVLLSIGMGLLAGVLICTGQRTAIRAAGQPPGPATVQLSRATSGLQVLYDFQSASGPLVKDRSGNGKPINLQIKNLQAVRRSVGSLEVRSPTVIASDKSAGELTTMMRRSGAITLEAWVTPANTKQEGPARILTFSNNSTNRNFTLGQEGTTFDVRLRTTKSSNNGLPSVETPQRSLARKLTHVAYTRDRGGRAKIFLNGKVVAEKRIAGELTNWDATFRLALADELSGGRSWLGTYHLVAIYARDLTAKEVMQNFRAGATTQPGLDQPDQTARRFELQVAPLLAHHCLECHDSVSRKGGLDLSRKTTALAGGESGKAIVAGKPMESLLWEQVESDEMPKDRSALSATEKKLLRKWLESGATWSLARIDPVVYAHRASRQQWIRRLTVDEYIETVRSTVDVDIASEAQRILPKEIRADGFTNTAYNLNVDLKHVESYAKLAEMIVKRMDVLPFVAKFSRRQKFTDKDMEDVISKMGKWILRGPLEEHEIIAYRGISTTVAGGGGNFQEAMRGIIEAMLQSPRFIYRIENQRGDGGAWPAGPYELASRLSYIIWGGPPDKDLMRAADDGKLSDREHVAEQVQRMLKDPRAVTRSLQFADQWLNLQQLGNLKPNAVKFPGWDPQLAEDMRAETLAFFKEVVWTHKRPLAELLNAQFTFATPRLAKHYGLKPQGAGIQRYDLSTIPGRGGLLTQGAVLTVGGDEASMVTRGLFILHDLLRGVVKDPPPCVDTTPVAARAGLTQRAISEARLANKACGGCHAKFEPLAFGLERFDGLGSYQMKDRHGNKLREDGKILLPGEARPVSYKSNAQMMKLLAGSDRVRLTLTWKLTQFSLGRPLGAADAKMVDQIHRAAQENGGTYTSLLTAIVMSDLVQLVQTDDNDQE
jgi:hypothetical protein